MKGNIHLLSLDNTAILMHHSNETEYMTMTDTFSPVLHRVDQAVRFRAVYPNEPIPPPYEILTKYSRPPEELVSNAKRQLENLIACADVKKGQLDFFPISNQVC